ncbi:MAG: hypothetical protein ACRD29_18515 [Acidimicrobiales bacterium]
MPEGRGRRAVFGALITSLVVVVAAGGTVAARWRAPSGTDVSLARVTPATAAAGHTARDAPTSTTVAPTVPTPTVPVPTAPAAFPRPPSPRFTVVPYTGLGTWLDVYDWSATFNRPGRDAPAALPVDIDLMVDVGVQTLFLQASKHDSPDDILEADRLLGLIHQAKARGLRVVAWYLPNLVDPATDLRRLLAIAELPVDGLAVDIESREVADPAERSRRLVELSTRLRGALPGLTLGAIVLPPVVMEDVNPNYWPGHPWAELAPLYDVWLPMNYWSFRRPDSGWRDGGRYTAENIDRVRARLGLPDAVVHPIGGVADGTSVADVDGMVARARERGAIGGSVYDFRTTAPELWPALAPFRS